MRALPYIGVFVAAVLEGETVFIAASVAVAMGRLNAWGVLVAGALGGAAGDQLVFYAVRGPLGRWLDQSPRFREKRDRLAPYVRRYAVPLITLSRFLPGLRLAIPAACAAAGVPAWLFSILNLASAFAWAAAITAAITWAGPNALAQLGITGWVGVVLPAVLMFAAFLLLRRITGAPPPARPSLPR